ncbi:MAG: efflux RND transporter periplasmic adaptor subunit [Rhodocyclaceae bacterium]|jgi:membrane fusion protein (multidrug efflux system)|nr:efflux RND transporter periplasmic adaptor subunit [Rhodocyclaceae bacterium]
MSTPTAPHQSVHFCRPQRLLAIAALLPLLLSACSEPGHAQSAGGMPPPQVTVQVARPATVPLTLELPATLVGSREVEIRARVPGIIEQRNFTEGGAVRRGQSLFTLDLVPFETRVARHEAEVAAARARAAQAQQHLARLRSLRSENAISQKNLDDAVSDDAVAAADLKVAEARLREARLDLSYARVESPIDGIAGRALVSDGTLVSGPEVLLTRVYQLAPIHVRFGLAESEAQRLRSDAAAGSLILPQDGHWRARVKLPDGSLHGDTGEVNFSDVRIDPQTGTGEMQAVVPNTDGALRPGQFVRVVLEGAQRRDAIVVPQRAVLDSGTGKYVYLLAPGQDGGTIAQQAQVEVGDWVRIEGAEGGENGWVIRKGLKAGDPVIVDGVARIFFPGMPVVDAAAQVAPTAAAPATSAQQ